MILLLFLLAASLAAQPRAPEVYVTAGLLRASGDESSFGTAGAYGGAVTVPLTRRLAVDVDVETGRFVTDRAPQTYYRLRRWLIRPSLLYRFGSDRLYGYAGGGVGAELNNSVTIEGNFLPDYRPPGWTEIAPGVWRTSDEWKDRLYHLRGGFVASPVPHLAIRVDLSAAAAHVLPNLGVKVGIGYRF